MVQILLCDDNYDELMDTTAHFDTYFTQPSDCPGDWANHRLHTFDNPNDALDFLECGNHVDIAVLDVLMPGMSGTVLAEKIRKLGYKGYIVFLTAVNDRASEAFGVRAFDYLLKPTSAEAITKLMGKLLEDYKNSDNEKFAVKIKTDMRIIKYRELEYAEVKGHNIYFYLDKADALKVYAPLKDYADAILRDKRMIKANNSFIVNIDYIKSFGNGSVAMQGGRVISVTGSFKDFKKVCYVRMFGGDEK